MFRMTVEDVFFIKGRGLVATGRIEEGTLRVSDEVRVNDAARLRVDGIEMFRKVRDEASAGENVGVLLRKASKDDVKRGDVLTTGAAAAPSAPPPPDVEQQHDAANRALGRDD
jgi:translation elongation factor EF-Tu-like GTPase